MRSLTKLIIMIVLSFLVSNLIMAEGNQEIKKEIAFGTCFVTSYKEAERLFFEGERSFPLLIGYFNDKTGYIGYLGANTRISDSKPSKFPKPDPTSIEAFKKKHPDGSMNNENEGVFRKYGLKRDAALYLLIAILKNDFDHAKNFKPKYKDVTQYEAALGCIAILYIRDKSRGIDLSWKDVKRILDEYKVEFK